jgi:hypothetical protein
MKRVRREQHLTLLLAAIGSAVTTSDRNAWGHGGVEEAERPSAESNAPRSAAEPSHRAPPGRVSFAAGTPPGTDVLPIETGALAADGASALIDLDLVLGWGRVPFAFQSLPTTGTSSVTYVRSDGVDANVQSLVVAASVELLRHVSAGLRLPLTFAEFFRDASLSRATASLGNIELAADYASVVARGLRLVASLAATLPTSQGNDIPADLDRVPAASVDAAAYDRDSLALAASAARGYEDSALFAPNRLGVVPKLTLAYDAYPFRVEPYVKVENLFLTSSSPAPSYLGDVVGGLAAGYWIERQFDVGLRGWCNVPYAGADKRVAISVEGSVLARFGPIRPYAGVIVPVAGPPSANGFLGVRLGVASVW